MYCSFCKFLVREILSGIFIHWPLLWHLHFLYSRTNFCTHVQFFCTHVQILYAHNTTFYRYLQHAQWHRLFSFAVGVLTYEHRVYPMLHLSKFDVFRGGLKTLPSKKLAKTKEQNSTLKLPLPNSSCCLRACTTRNTTSKFYNHPQNNTNELVRKEETRRTIDNLQRILQWRRWRIQCRSNDYQAEGICISPREAVSDWRRTWT